MVAGGVVGATVVDAVRRGRGAETEVSRPPQRPDSLPCGGAPWAHRSLDSGRRSSRGEAGRASSVPQSPHDVAGTHGEPTLTKLAGPTPAHALDCMGGRARMPGVHRQRGHRDPRRRRVHLRVPGWGLRPHARRRQDGTQGAATGAGRSRQGSHGGTERSHAGCSTSATYTASASRRVDSRGCQSPGRPRSNSSYEPSSRVSAPEDPISRSSSKPMAAPTTGASWSRYHGITG